MTIARWSASVALAALVLAGSATAQTPTRDKAKVLPASGTSETAAIAEGWTALAAGRHDEALKKAEGLLSQNPANHHARGLQIEAQSHGAPLTALDSYEKWLAKTRVEDVFLLDPIARGTLEQIAAGGDQPLRLRALRQLATHGDSRAATLLQEVQSAAGLSDVQLALEGDAAAAKRLIDPKVAQKVQPQLLARGLSAGGSAAAPALRSLLKHPAAPVRMEAALSLGKIDAVDAAPELKALLNDPEVRAYAAVALVRLGDTEAEPLVQEMLQSSVLDLRVLAAQAYEGRGAGPWVQALMPALEDPNGLTRIRAAELLAPVAPEAARPVLEAAARDANPVVRADSMRVIERTHLFAPAESPQSAPGSAETSAPQGLATLRRLLRDPDPTTRLSAASALLRISAGR